jgi:hypothetical protein
VQFVTFCREGSEGVRRWWEERCIEWCYGRVEDGKFGDQKYLDDWTGRFPEFVHVLQHQEWMLAPWNSIRFPYSGAICHHFHRLRIADDSRAILPTEYSIPHPTLTHVYTPYLQDIKKSILALNEVGHTVAAQQEIVANTFLSRIILKLRGLGEFSWRYAPDNMYRF